MPALSSRLGLVPGDLIRANYRLKKILGAGGFGEVWHAEQFQGHEHLRDVALKVFVAPELEPGAASATSATRSGWLHEARTIMEIEQVASVPRTYDVGIDTGHNVAFIAMELLHGQVLEARLADGALSWRRSLLIARAIAGALQHCHRSGIVHCDLKPQNIFLTDTDRVVVLDFGIASLRGFRATALRPPRPLSPTRAPATDASRTEQVADSEVQRLAMSRIDFIAGTPGYIAPEQLAGLPPESDADIYALGVVLYRMITGAMPYRVEPKARVDSGSDTSPGSKMHAFNIASMNASIIPITEKAPHLPASVASLVQRMLARKPDRISSEDVSSALSDVWEHPHGVPNPPFVGLSSFSPRHAGWLPGRVHDIARSVEHLRKHRGVALAGPSGSGKSSLAQAGVAAELDRRLVDEADGWEIVVIRPSGETALDVDAQSVPPPPLLRSGKILIVDQLEEILTLEPSAQLRFASALLSVVSTDAPRRRHIILRGERIHRDTPLRLIATVRDDLFAKVAAVGGLRPFLEQNLLIVPGVDPSAARSIAIAPAHALGVVVDDPDAVMEEVAEVLRSDPTALPLIQFALTLWWDRDFEKGRLTRETWRSIGGVQGGLHRVAQQLYQESSADARAHIRELLLLLFRADGTRSQLHEGRIPAAARPALESLLERRLVRWRKTASGRAVEVVHESLMGWPELDTWLKESRVERELVEDAQRHAARWRAAGSPSRVPDELLWSALRFEQALKLGDKLGDARDFVAAGWELANGRLREMESQERRALEQQREADRERYKAELERERRERAEEGALSQRRTISILTGTVALLGVMLALFAWQYIVAERSKARLAELDQREREDAALLQQAAEALLLAQQAGKERDALRIAIKAAGRSTQQGRVVPSRVMQGLAGAVATPEQRPVVLRHGDEIVAADFSHDGSRVLTASRDSSAHLWDAVSGRSIRALAGHTGPVLGAAFSLDNARIFTISSDRTARLWNAASGDPLATWQAVPQAGRFLAAMAPDASRAVLSQSDGTVRLVDLRHGQTIGTLRGHSSPISAVAFAPNGLRLVTACTDGSAWLWAADTGGLVAAMRRHTGALPQVSFSPNGARIVTVGEDRTASLWSDQGTHLATMMGHTDTILGAVFSNDSATLATHSSDHSAIVWETNSGRQSAVLWGHTGPVLDVAFSADGRRLVTASADSTAKIWSVGPAGGVVNSEPEVSLSGHTDYVRMARFSPDGSRVLTASDDTTARLWNSRNGNLVATLEGHTDKVRIGRFSPDGARLITVGDDNTARLWDASLSNAIPTLKGHTAPVRRAHFSPDGARTVTVSDDKTARLWDPTYGLVRALEGHSGPVVSAVFAGDGSSRLLTLAEDDPTLRLWNSQSGDLLAAVSHAGPVLAAAFRRDGARIITAGADDTVRHWDIATGKEVQADLCQGVHGGVDMAALAPGGQYALTATRDSNRATLTGLAGCVPIADLVGHSGPISGAVFSPDGALVATISTDNTTKLWSTRYGNDLDTLDTGSGAVHSVAFARDGSRLVVATARDAWVYQLTEEGTRTEVLATLQGHSAAVMHASFSANTTRIVTASSDNTAKLWAAANPGYELIATLHGHSAAVSFADFSPDGTLVVTASRDSRAKVYPTTLEGFLRKACDALRSHPDEFEEVADICGA